MFSAKQGKMAFAKILASTKKRKKQAFPYISMLYQKQKSSQMFFEKKPSTLSIPHFPPCVYRVGKQFSKNNLHNMGSKQ